MSLKSFLFLSSLLGGETSQNSVTASNIKNASPANQTANFWSELSAGVIPKISEPHLRGARSLQESIPMLNSDEAMSSVRLALNGLSTGFDPASSPPGFNLTRTTDCCGEITGVLHMSRLVVTSQTAIGVDIISQNSVFYVIPVYTFSASYAFNEGTNSASSAFIEDTNSASYAFNEGINPRSELERQITAGTNPMIEFEGQITAEDSTYNCRISAGLRNGRGKVDVLRLDFSNLVEYIVSALDWDEGILTSPTVTCTRPDSDTAAELLSQDVAASLDGAEIRSGISVRDSRSSIRVRDSRSGVRGEVLDSVDSLSGLFERNTARSALGLP